MFTPTYSHLTVRTYLLTLTLTPTLTAVPAAIDTARGIFNLFLSTQGLENNRLAKGLAETATVMLATQVGFRLWLGLGLG
jgi:hypothetical protein